MALFLNPNYQLKGETEKCDLAKYSKTGAIYWIESNTKNKLYKYKDTSHYIEIM